MDLIWSETTFRFSKSQNNESLSTYEKISNELHFAVQVALLDNILIAIHTPHHHEF